jgi:hypothetical protein
MQRRSNQPASGRSRKNIVNLLSDAKRRRLEIEIIRASQQGQSDDNRFDLAGGEHKRRKVEARSHNVADARLAFNWNAHSLKRGDVAVHGPLRHFERFGHSAGGHRRLSTPQNLDNLEQTI